MVFSSSVFIFCFLPLTILGFLLVNRFNPKFINIWTVLMSLLFYSWGEPKYVLLIILSLSVNHFLVILMQETQDQDVRKMYLGVSIIFNIALLLYFKYAWFLLENINSIFGPFGIKFNNPNISLPLGISFFTFQIISYAIDVYWKKVKAQNSIVPLATYILLFSQLIAGPIVRYCDIENQIKERKVTLDGFANGIKRFVIGFAKKIIIANTVSTVADYAFQSKDLTLPLSWLGIICYALQIYYDFSGYSDMAIGMARMFGFDFKENFNYPYISTSIQDFWRRWHISLSTWFRDYVYIPLGGNRKGTLPTYRNLLIVFMVTGLWHGAAWNFIVWGLIHGFFIVMEKMFLGKILQKIPSFISRIYTLLVILIGWVLFRAEDLRAAVKYILTMFNFNKLSIGETLSIMDNYFILALLIGIIFSIPILKYLNEKIPNSRKGLFFKNITSYSSVILLFILSIGCLAANSGYNPFIYFRF